MKNTDYKIGDPVWIDLKFLSSRELLKTKGLILINTIEYKDINPFYVYWTKILGIITNITDIYEGHKGIEQLVTVYCKSYFFCCKCIQKPEFGSLKFYIPEPEKTPIKLKEKLQKKEISVHSKEIEELNTRFKKYCKKCKKIKEIKKIS